MKTAHFARLQFGESGGSASDRVVAIPLKNSPFALKPV